MLTATKIESASPQGYERLKNPEFNKGTAFTEEERDRFRLRGLLPAGVSDPDVQEARVLANLRRKAYELIDRTNSKMPCAKPTPRAHPTFSTYK